MIMLSELSSILPSFHRSMMKLYNPAFLRKIRLSIENLHFRSQSVLNAGVMRIPVICWTIRRRYSAQTVVSGLTTKTDTITIYDKTYTKDEYTNVTPRIASFIGRNLHNKQYHPLSLVKESISRYFYENFIGRTGNPIFSVYDNLKPIVTLEENFDSLLVPESHVSRQKSDSYYINKKYMLRGHTTAHQAELIRMGLDNFLIFGDVYRRDEIDSAHYPVFHQVDGIYSLNKDQIENVLKKEITMFENAAQDTEEKQGVYTIEASKFVELHLKTTLIGMTRHLYDENVPHRWVPAFFPFTHPSWELEIQLNGKWIEILGCGIIRHEILKTAGAGDRIGWAFGIGLERLAMHRYQIPDIRLFWSQDTGFTSQFENATPETKIVYKPISVQPQCINDISFFLAEDKQFCHNDFYELVRNVGGDFVEQVMNFMCFLMVNVKPIDEFFHPKKNRLSRTYKIVYRHMERPLKKSEVNVLHTRISNSAERLFDVEIRR